MMQQKGADTREDDHLDLPVSSRGFVSLLDRIREDNVILIAGY
jgi:hypothetical protein